MEMSSYLYPSPDQADLLMHNRQVTHNLLRGHLLFTDIILRLYLDMLDAFVSAHRPVTLMKALQCKQYSQPICSVAGIPIYNSKGSMPSALPFCSTALRGISVLEAETIRIIKRNA
jgi:hypothetical protein